MTPAGPALAPPPQASLVDDLEWRRELLREREHPLEPARERPGEGRLTLAMRIASVWEGLSSSGAAACPMCGAEMEWRAGEGLCRGCGTVLS